ncbi:FkbM family methyltransferase [Massilia phyllosphaerae]|uniref:FkbM family methyltransferase n=1 Tax=Massilia phyllosphaerae TaxID=3106034 RepID=UPI002B1CE0EE|nr:FkbM family methyltransferase [Massilia sp. SGZ-792]
MPFLSYAQNNEDVLLWRAIGDVDPASGFYIDVGASDPVEHSVTKAFYDAGWRGINIEPLPAHAAAFAEQRPRDLNLAIAAGSAEGSLTLYDVPAVRGWASPDPAVAAMHRAAGHAVAELTVPVRPLAAVCAEHVRGPIHFLKIDVEGFEGEVLRGMDFGRWRPWVLVIEATLPNSRATCHQGWEHLVTGHGYRFAWFDGLNRYYVAPEHAALLRHFGVQPNVFDDYISYHLERAWEATRRSQQALQASDARLDEALRRADALAHEQHGAQAEAEADAARAAAAEAQRGIAAAQAATITAQAATIGAQAGALQARKDATNAWTRTTQALAEAAAARMETVQARDAAAGARAETAQARHAAAAAQAEAAQARTHAAAERDQAGRIRAELVRAHAAGARAHAGIAEAQAEIARLHGEYEQAVANGRQVAAWAHHLEQRLLATLASPSWKLTEPLRTLGAFARRLNGAGLARRTLQRVVQHASTSERMRRTLIPVLLRYPALNRRVSSLLRRVRQAPPVSTAASAALAVPEDLRHLPASARSVLADLRRARGRQRQQQHQQQQESKPCAS